MLKCYAFQNIDKSINTILLFGLVRPVVQRKIVSFDYFGETTDQYGNIYKIYSEYDPALKHSATFVIKTTEKKEM